MKTKIRIRQYVDDFGTGLTRRFWHWEIYDVGAGLTHGDPNNVVAYGNRETWQQALDDAIEELRASRVTEIPSALQRWAMAVGLWAKRDRSDYTLAH